ncbi:hypothetical protein [Hymenobacter arizonensis]|uniref:SPFH domain / Band 7 family protein n=1 Tax=Hymenobacter arizonensis TaxID=1227077 RepID=A0A1I5Z317_HYMAR|nr:hypothetical protein [Hymenobacter arizonensis]SFQ50863.1 hypothetical protein SAMN04515668_2661 [Hymenobacter arizonensis]
MKKTFLRTQLKSLTFVGLFACLLPVSLSSCDYAKANVNTLVTDDCGVNWSLIEAGKSVPKGVGNPCFYKVTIPDYPMQGDSHFKVVFAENVLASLDVSYDYTITNPMSFIQEAKYLGKTNTTEVSTQFEAAENTVIDKRIKDAVRGRLSKEDVVTFSPSDFEDLLLPEVNKLLQPRGVTVNFLSLVPVYDEQTAQAVDVATAMKIYSSKNLEKLGEQVIANRAGASRLVVENKLEPTPVADEKEK